MARHKETKDYKVGVYVRLSKEDSRAGESVSIENQKLMLVKHVKDNGWDLVEIYQDDGFSGTNQKRPAFQRMMADVKSGCVNTVLIKDLSRLGRNYLEVGNLAEVFLPEHGCELISLNEKLDDMMVFRNWFNEQHSKSTSTKVRAAKRVSAQNGKFMGAYAPYGYKKDPQNRHKLVIDENVAPIVRRIFELKASGISRRGIATQLNEDGIASPKEYYYSRQERKNPLKTSRKWSESSIKDILQNEVYIGNMVSGKQGTVSYKNQSLLRKDKDSWIRVENTHEAIIILELWEKVNSIRTRKYKPSRRADSAGNLFTGLLYCADCGFKLRGQTERYTRKDGSEHKTVTYMCSTYGRSGKGACTIHSINEKVLAGLVTEHIQRLAKQIDFDEEHMLNAIVSAQNSDSASYRSNYIAELESHKKQIAKLDLLIESLYGDKISGLIPDSLFKRQIEKYEQERVERNQVVNDLEKRIRTIKPIENDAHAWVRLIKQYADECSLNHQLLLLLIDKIIIGEARYVEGKRICDIRVVYNYVGDVDKVVM